MHSVLYDIVEPLLDILDLNSCPTNLCKLLTISIIVSFFHLSHLLFHRILNWLIKLQYLSIRLMHLKILKFIKLGRLLLTVLLISHLNLRNIILHHIFEFLLIQLMNNNTLNFNFFQKCVIR